MIKQIYEQVYDYIESDVHQRAPGESLPSEMQYSMQLAVSRLTVRKAVDDAASRYHYDYKLLNFPTAAEQYRAVLAEDLTAYDGAVITCFDSEAEQCTLNLIQRANLPVCILGNEHEGVPSIGATSTPRNTA